MKSLSLLAGIIVAIPIGLVASPVRAEDDWEDRYEDYREELEDRREEARERWEDRQERRRERIEDYYDDRPRRRRHVFRYRIPYSREYHRTYRQPHVVYREPYYYDDGPVYYSEPGRYYRDPYYYTPRSGAYYGTPRYGYFETPYGTEGVRVGPLQFEWND